MKKSIFFIILLAVTLSCSKDDLPPELLPPKVYVAGIEYNSKGMDVPTLWVDGGIAQYLGDGSYRATVASVCASGSNVYVAGVADVVKTDGTYHLVTLWSNNTIAQHISSTQGGVYSTYASGNDVHVAGWSTNEQSNLIATLWRNGVAELLPHKGTRGIATHVHVSGSDVYVTGLSIDDKSIGTSVVWHNGEVKEITDGVVSMVYVSENDVYMAGLARNAKGEQVAALWCNDVIQYLSSNATITSIFVEGNDVYAAGYENAESRQVIMWKNGEEQPHTGNYKGYINHVCLHGSDLYAVGYEENAEGTEVAVLWKNGVPQYLSGDKRSRANHVFVK